MLQRRWFLGYCYATGNRTMYEIHIWVRFYLLAWDYITSWLFISQFPFSDSCTDIHQGCCTSTGLIVWYNKSWRIFPAPLKKPRNIWIISVDSWPQQNTAKQKLRTYFLGNTVNWDISTALLHGIVPGNKQNILFYIKGIPITNINIIMRVSISSKPPRHFSASSMAENLYWRGIQMEAEVETCAISISQVFYDVIINIFLRKSYRFWWKWLITTLHMPRQLSCRDMCKVVIWLDY